MANPPFVVGTEEECAGNAGPPARLPCFAFLRPLHKSGEELRWTTFTGLLCQRFLPYLSA